MDFDLTTPNSSSQLTPEVNMAGVQQDVPSPWKTFEQARGKGGHGQCQPSTSSGNPEERLKKETDYLILKTSGKGLTISTQQSSQQT